MTIASTLQLIQQHLAVENLDAAIDAAEAALVNGETHPAFLTLAAHRQEVQGNYDSALRLLDQALKIAPNDVTTLNAIGHCWIKQAAPKNALRAFIAALQQEERFAPSHYGSGLALAALGDDLAAKAAHERAVELDPAYPDPLGALAVMELQARRYKNAKALAERALALDPNEPASLLTIVTVAKENGDYRTVEDLARQGLEGDRAAPLQRATFSRLLGDALDARGEFDAAFSAYSTSAAIHNRAYQLQHAAPGLESATDLNGRIARQFTQPGFIWKDTDSLPRQAASQHLFLVGFPRSGTTLLEQVFASHSGIVAQEEKPTLVEPISRYFLERDDLRDLNDLTASALQAEVDDYWDHVAALGVEVTGRAFLDKQPSLTTYIPLLVRLFPDAKIIVAIRDPRDVVLSCYRRGFNMNRTVYEFTDLVRLARYYNSTMELATLYSQRFAKNIVWHRHEDMVRDFDHHIANLCRQLAINYEPGMRDFVATAKRRDIRTPSAQQVRQGLNRSGVGYWRNYRSHLHDALEILRPWVEHFDYED